MQTKTSRNTEREGVCRHRWTDRQREGWLCRHRQVDRLAEREGGVCSHRCVDSQREVVRVWADREL